MSKFCSKCGNELMDEAVICPKCGCLVKNFDRMKTLGHNTEKYNQLSVLGIVLAGVSLLLNFWGIVGIAAVVISSIALVQISKTNEKGKALAITGICVGGFSILYAAIILSMLAQSF